MIDFFLTLKGMLKAGVTLLESLRTIGKEVDNPFFRKTINEVISSVEAGKLFSDSLAGYKRIFSDHVIGMIKAGECGGTLPETFGELVRYLEWQESIKADVRQATFYPITVLIALLGFITVLFTFVVPRFIKLLASLKVALPFPTRLVMSTSDFFVATWWIWLFAGVFFPIAVKYARKKWEWFAVAFDKFKLNIVIFGELNRMLVISRFAHNFAALFKSGVPILQNLELCLGLVGSKVLEKALGDARADIEGGMPLHESLRKHDVFPAKALMMISVGETSGDLGGALDNVASYYNEEIPRRIKKVFAVMEPLIMLFLISIVGFSAVAIILPILSLFGNIK
jgi:type IV pilus assembly protein PilC